MREFVRGVVPLVALYFSTAGFYSAAWAWESEILASEAPLQRIYGDTLNCPKGSSTGSGSTGGTTTGSSTGSGTTNSCGEHGGHHHRLLYRQRHHKLLRKHGRHHHRLH